MNIFKKGFTLVEILITLAVLGTAVGVGTASYVSFNERQVVEQVALELKNNFKLIQQRALSGEKDITLCKEGTSTVPLAGWCFSPDESTPGPIDEYLLYGSCGPDTTGGVTPFPANPQRVGLPEGVTIKHYINNSPNIGGRILFEAGKSSIKISGIDPATGLEQDYPDIIYCLESNLPATPNSQYKITVTEFGEIIDEGFVSCPT
ncbi:hypothetical protein A3A55_02000 [Candidatus Roizmanbacteria bacterium RIFCSPLOWO2_01_FULL_40_14]|uniref:Prepilin-type cleavage/methylation protein n=2 Tax=Candidatus Roizmaniibacteriota TaxID=1752723 RepID=A0A0G0VGM9_9BACT|nr:MAG: Prepilin-type cleavage/methylation protein [Candidatus Levybacteria bacterium GW2011_GWA2_40_16]KKR71205.1 MAG: Prepilin-type cleavage/methylation protein [Candidatus Roizmanbacteria bacterium GW2011_GWB1_40_7]KKR94410.1 MAG: Prepilin-type cleavage/methylation protein [Candidatus Roizmanbacteria bacterium GW2011_GWA1_41_13]OGK49841.1 MAG: hypothetical protein A3A55_02000 [Candidatus Roizmanbacteria bacterium RIFCSPLOWO2_01_FULL_40_14]